MAFRLIFLPAIFLLDRQQLSLTKKRCILFECETMAEAQARVSHFLEEVYNQKRLRSAVGYEDESTYWKIEPISEYIKRALAVIANQKEGE